MHFTLKLEDGSTAESTRANGKSALFSGMGGSEMPGVIREVSGDSTTVDFNHPLAGQRIKFEIEVLDIDPVLEAGDANPVS